MINSKYCCTNPSERKKLQSKFNMQSVLDCYVIINSKKNGRFTLWIWIWITTTIDVMMGGWESAAQKHVETSHDFSFFLCILISISPHYLTISSLFILYLSIHSTPAWRIRLKHNFIRFEQRSAWNENGKSNNRARDDAKTSRRDEQGERNLEF